MSRRRAWPALLLGAYLLLALGYGAVNPLFEAPDEHYHFFTARFVAATGRLPSVPPAPAIPDPLLGQEAAQPPLYYALGAMILAPLDTADAAAELWLNPRVLLGDASAATNRNRAVHTAAEAWPWRGWALAAHALRAFSALLGLGTLACLYRSARLLWPARERRALLAVGLVAFLPQFAFHHGAISNDPLIIFLASAGIYQLLRLWRGPLTTSRLALLGLTIGAAILTKAAGLLLLAYALGWLAAQAWWQRDAAVSAGAAVRAGTRAIAIVGGVALAVSGWLLWRHWTLYGDITAANQFVRLAGGETPLSLGEALAQLWAVRASFVAVFGWFNLRGPAWIYVIWAGIALAALGGLVWRGRGRRDPLPWLLAAWPALVAAGMLAFMMRTPAAQGRLLFPALVPLALGLAAGLDAWPRPVSAAALGLALATSLAGVGWVIPRAYARPPVIAESAIPTTATRLDAEMGGGLTLVGAEAETRETEPGMWLWLTLYWRVDAPLPESPAPRDALGGRAPEEVILLLGREETPVGKLQTYHGGGLYPATLWPGGGVIVDRLAVRLAEGMAAPVAVTPLVSLVGAGLPNDGPSVALPPIPVHPVRWPAPREAPLAALGPAIALGEAALEPLAVDPGETLTVTARWQASGPVDRDYTAFVHLGPPGEPPLATGDAPPLEGDYPTRFWAAGTVVEDDVYRLTVPPDLPPGRYPVSLGLYDPLSGERLPLVVAGTRQPFDAWVVGVVEVR